MFTKRAIAGQKGFQDGEMRQVLWAADEFLALIKPAHGQYLHGFFRGAGPTIPVRAEEGLHPVPAFVRGGGEADGEQGAFVVA